MCSHYQGIQRPESYREIFKAEPPAAPGKEDMWPCYQGCFIRRHPHADVGDEAVPAHEALIGQFGLVPHWAEDLKLGRHTFNARSETVATKPSFRDAWRQARHCIIPAMAIYEPDWRSGKAIATRISRADDQPMGIAGLWDQWKSPGGDTVHSFTMLTINADEQRTGDEASSQAQPSCWLSDRHAQLRLGLLQCSVGPQLWWVLTLVGTLCPDDRQWPGPDCA